MGFERILVDYSLLLQVSSWVDWDLCCIMESGGFLDYLRLHHSKWPHAAVHKSNFKAIYLNPTLQVTDWPQFYKLKQICDNNAKIIHIISPKMTKWHVNDAKFKLGSHKFYTRIKYSKIFHNHLFTFYKKTVRHTEKKRCCFRSVKKKRKDLLIMLHLHITSLPHHMCYIFFFCSSHPIPHIKC